MSLDCCWTESQVTFFNFVHLSRKWIFRKWRESWTITNANWSNCRLWRAYTGLLTKGNQKLHALMRIKKYLCKQKLKLIMRTFESQFNYCLRIWVSNSKDLNRKINKLDERAPRSVYKDKHLSLNSFWIEKVINSTWKKSPKTSSWNV